jgi:hypothetical protein
MFHWSGRVADSDDAEVERLSFAPFAGGCQEPMDA